MQSDATPLYCFEMVQDFVKFIILRHTFLTVFQNIFFFNLNNFTESNRIALICFVLIFVCIIDVVHHHDDASRLNRRNQM